MSTLQLEGITVERGGRPVVKDVSLTVPAGQVTALRMPAKSTPAGSKRNLCLLCLQLVSNG